MTLSFKQFGIIFLGVGLCLKIGGFGGGVDWLMYVGFTCSLMGIGALIIALFPRKKDNPFSY